MNPQVFSRQAVRSLRDQLDSAPNHGRWLWGTNASVCLEVLREQGSIANARQLAGQSVLIATGHPLSAALALIDLDGVAGRIIIATPDLASDQLSAIAKRGGVDAVISDRNQNELWLPDVSRVIPCGCDVPERRPEPAGRHETEWVLLTSGTTGTPKLVVHTLATLTAPFLATPNDSPDVVWGTFYDIRRYGGLQILLRALFGRGSFVISGAGESVSDYLSRLAARSATHISGTATHWRRALMSPKAAAISPRYVRLSGEVADQGILNSLQARFPNARVGHAFASTEAGVAFDVDDGREGFPADDVDATGEVQIAVVDGSLRIRSPRTALRYLDGAHTAVADADGFVDTGDMVDRRGDRYYFRGRRTGVINVGGLKVYPEEVEAAINRHPAVRMSLVRGRKNAITGSLVSADVVLTDPDRAARPEEIALVKYEILRLCREKLAPYKVPAILRIVPALDVAAAGKLARHDA